MALIQINVDDKLKRAIEKKAEIYDVPSTSLIRIVLVKTFLLETDKNKPGNVFNAERDNNGKGMKIDDLIDRL